jgi:threonine/homoserine/homoserine lactone efflux protein
MAVLLSSSVQQYKKAFWISVGGSLPESVFAAVAIYASSIIIRHQDVLQVLSKGFALAFIMFGIYLFVRKSRLAVPEQNSSEKGFLIGFLISVVNPQLILFWVAVITSMELNQFHITALHPVIQTAFLLGTSVGGFIVHILLLIICRKYQQSRFLTAFSLYSNKIVGCVFALLGLSQWLMS